MTDQWLEYLHVWLYMFPHGHMNLKYIILQYYKLCTVLHCTYCLNFLHLSFSWQFENPDDFALQFHETNRLAFITERVRLRRTCFQLLIKYVYMY